MEELSEPLVPMSHEPLQSMDPRESMGSSSAGFPLKFPGRVRMYPGKWDRQTHSSAQLNSFALQKNHSRHSGSFGWSRRWWFHDCFRTLLSKTAVVTVFLFFGSNVLLWLACSGLLYAACPSQNSLGGESHSFSSVFWLSMQTATTIGYGHIFPNTPTCNAASGFTAVLSALLDAFWIGLLFTRFSRATEYAGVKWSAQCTIGESSDGDLYVSCRMLDLRKRPLVDCSIRLFGTVWLDTPTGPTLKTYQLKLVDGSGEAEGFYIRPIMNLPATLSHNLSDPSSPLHALKERACWEARGVQLICILEGIDPYTSNSLQLQKLYPSSDLMWGWHFQEMIELNQDGTFHVELSKLDACEARQGK
eukprot:TRINITY_DN36479_c0_g1_i2.p1 TRINITY_DN36479_c0_g1~~TRINITY_DN36479_c0_g1_i2.p1  ORF type:complete len:361 (+),score=40.26 TRINITY_DN36479_c0_g1_i2:174-1256(+)